MPRLLSIAALLLSSAALLRGQLQAGAAQAVITPDLPPGHPVYLAGFGHNRIATGVHDDLSARCLALRAAERPLVLCSVDLIGLFYEDVLTVRARLAHLTPSQPFLIVASTHTHAGPDTLGLYGPQPLASGIDPHYLDWVDTRIAATAAQAIRALEPARLLLGRDDHPLLGLLQGVDRPPIVKDPYLFALRLIARDGRTIATLVNWSDHPETLGRKNTEITSDYPHWARTHVERRYGGIALFFSGALGKVSPLGQVALVDPDTGVLAGDGTWRKAELLGTEVAQLAERALQNGRQAPVGSLVVRSQAIFVPLENPLFRAAQAAGVFNGRKPLYANGRLEAATGSAIRSEVDYVQLRSNGAPIAEIVTIPGEIYPELVNGGVQRYPGADYPGAPIEPPLRAELHSRYQFIFGLGNDELGYLIPRAEWDQQPPWLMNAPAPFYGEVNSAGPDAAGAVLHALIALIHL